MKALIALLLLLGAFVIVKRLYLTYQSVEKHPAQTEDSAVPPKPSAASSLPGLPAALEPSLSAAEKQGAAGLGEWLRNYRTQVRDPRLAAIELDYVALITVQDPAEARRIFLEVKNRTPTFSPIYDRVKRLERTFQ
ncbi:MAG: hypothetical protein U1G07_13960 [Verrucomicrobiota bacterium]